MKERDREDNATYLDKGTRLTHDGRERPPEIGPDTGESSVFVEKARKDPPKRFK